MSQAKVDRYKEEKVNRKKTVARQKRQSILVKCILVLIVAALIVWVAFSIRNWIVNNTPVTYTYVNLDPITNYLSGLSAQ